MNKTDLLEKFHESIDNCSDSLLINIKNIKFEESFKPAFMKSLRKLLLIEFRIMVLLDFMEKIQKISHLYKKLNSEIKDIQNFNQSLKKCEICIYSLFTEIEKIIDYNFAKN